MFLSDYPPAGITVTLLLRYNGKKRTWRYEFEEVARPGNVCDCGVNMLVNARSLLQGDETFVLDIDGLEYRAQFAQTIMKEVWAAWACQMKKQYGGEVEIKKEDEEEITDDDDVIMEGNDDILE